MDPVYLRHAPKKGDEKQDKNFFSDKKKLLKFPFFLFLFVNTTVCGQKRYWISITFATTLSDE